MVMNEIRPVSRPLHQRVALVTGGGRGIGRATAIELARLGAAMGVLARSPGHVNEVAGKIQSMGRPALAFPADLADYAAIQTAVQQIAATLGSVTVLVNAAGVMPLGPLSTSDPAGWRYALEVNLVGAYHCLRAVLLTMLEQRWGRVISISSVVATVQSIRNRSAYVVSKAALDRLTPAGDAELGGTGVTVNTVYPGLTDTPMLAQIRDAPVELIGAEQQALFADTTSRVRSPAG